MTTLSVIIGTMLLRLPLTRRVGVHLLRASLHRSSMRIMRSMQRANAVVAAEQPARTRMSAALRAAEQEQSNADSK